MAGCGRSGSREARLTDGIVPYGMLFFRSEEIFRNDVASCAVSCRPAPVSTPDIMSNLG
jgi:hypothetical protein